VPTTRANSARMCTLGPAALEKQRAPMAIVKERKYTYAPLRRRLRWRIGDVARRGRTEQIEAVCERGWMLCVWFFFFGVSNFIYYSIFPRALSSLGLRGCDRSQSNRKLMTYR
jgi:hypothetical protein